MKMKKFLQIGMISILTIILFTACQPASTPVPAWTPSQTALPNPETISTAMPTEDQPVGEVSLYTIQQDDTLFTIALAFDLEPYTILWANPTLSESLGGLPVGKQIRIPPVNGYYYVWQNGDRLEDVVKEYGGDIQSILRWNVASIQGEYPEITITPGSEIFIPHGAPVFEEMK